MPLAKLPAIPTTEPALMRWILQDPAHVRVYITAEGPHWVAATKARVRQAFGESNSGLANSIAWAAMAVLNAAAEKGQLSKVVALGPWIDGTIRHLVSKALREHRRGKKNLSIDLMTLVARTQEPADAEESATVVQQVRDCLSRLSPRERQILEMMFQDLDDPPSDQDVASTLGCSPGSVRTQRCTGRMRMIDCLKKKGVQP
jgi:RNA polymerase sigma factor (sigma-70 family)